MKNTFFKRTGHFLLKFLNFLLLMVIVHPIEIAIDIRNHGWKHSNWHKHIYAGAAFGSLGYMIFRPVFSPLHWFVEIFLFTFCGGILISFFEGIQSKFSGKIENERDSDDRIKDIIVTTFAMSLAMILCKIAYLIAR